MTCLLDIVPRIRPGPTAFAILLLVGGPALGAEGERAVSGAVGASRSAHADRGISASVQWTEGLDPWLSLAVRGQFSATGGAGPWLTGVGLLGSVDALRWIPSAGLWGVLLGMDGQLAPSAALSVGLDYVLRPGLRLGGVGVFTPAPKEVGGHRLDAFLQFTFIWERD